jgi:hypothetical protein
MKRRKDWVIYRLGNLKTRMSCPYTILPNVERSVYVCRTFGVLYYSTVLGLVERSTSYGRTFGIPFDTMHDA